MKMMMDGNDDDDDDVARSNGGKFDSGMRFGVVEEGRDMKMMTTTTMTTKLDRIIEIK